MWRRSPISKSSGPPAGMARAAGKHVVALKLGQSEGGRQAAMAHTGSLAGAVEAFDAVAGEVGVIRADTLDDVVEMTELLAHTGAPGGTQARRHHAVGRVPWPPARRRRAQSTCNSIRSRRPRPRGSIPSHGRLAGLEIRSTAASACSPAPTTTWPRSRRCRPTRTSTSCCCRKRSPREPGSARGENYIRMVEDYAATKRKSRSRS